MRFSFLSLHILSWAISSLACATKASVSQGDKAATPVASHPSSPDDMSAADKLIHDYLAYRLERDPGLAREAGLYEYDGKLADIGLDRSTADVRRAEEFIARVDALDPKKFTDPVRLDLEIVRQDAAAFVFSVEELQAHRRILTYDGLFDVTSYLMRDYAPLAERIQRMLTHIERATELTDAVLQIQLAVQPRTHLETAKKSLGGMREFFETDVAKTVHAVLKKDPQLTARYERSVARALHAVDKLIAWTDNALVRASDDFALGEAKFLKLLSVNEGLHPSLSELEQMATADWQKNRQAFLKTAASVFPDLPPRAAARKIESERIGANDVMATAKRQMGELLEFLTARPIVTMSASERVEVLPSPAFMRWNSAFIDVSGPFDPASGSFYYISPPDPTWPAAMQADYLPYEGDLLATTIHEVYPGHFVHSVHRRKAPTELQKMLRSYAFTEGWAHYVEQMMFDEGLAEGDGRRRLGQLSNALLRNCRFLAAIGLHTKSMKVPEAETLFKEQCFIDAGNAKQQAYRGTFDPGYFSYTLGKLEIIRLRDAFFLKRKTRDLKMFHDWVLSFGGPPIALLKDRI